MTSFVPPHPLRLHLPDSSDSLAAANDSNDQLLAASSQMPLQSPFLTEAQE